MLVTFLSAKNNPEVYHHLHLLIWKSGQTHIIWAWYNTYCRNGQLKLRNVLKNKTVDCVTLMVMMVTGKNVCKSSNWILHRSNQTNELCVMQRRPKPLQGSIIASSYLWFINFEQRWRPNGSKPPQKPHHRPFISPRGHRYWMFFAITVTFLILQSHFYLPSLPTFFLTLI